VGSAKRLRLGTRGSRLALIQSELVAQRLREAGHDVELVTIVTEGDVRPIDMSPGEGVFVAAIARALLAGEIDIAVHSAKDIPLEEDPGLVIAAYPERADPRDVLITKNGGASLESLGRGATVGTDSPRRTGFLLAARPDLRVIPLHGNVETRIKRMDAGSADAIVLAAAGIDQRFEPELVAPAPGQGALAVQVRRGDSRILELVSAIDDQEVRLAVEAEREVLRATGGTCRAPVGALASITHDSFSLLVAGVNSDGTGKLVERVEGDRAAANDVAARLGHHLVERIALR
jgi:hydroxymethylbilane synthase